MHLHRSIASHCIVNENPLICNDALNRQNRKLQATIWILLHSKNTRTLDISTSKPASGHQVARCYHHVTIFAVVRHEVQYELVWWARETCVVAEFNTITRDRWCICYLYNKKTSYECSKVNGSFGNVHIQVTGDSTLSFCRPMYGEHVIKLNEVQS